MPRALFPALPKPDSRPHTHGSITSCRRCYYAIQLTDGGWITSPDGRADCHDSKAHVPAPPLTVADLPA